MSSAGTTPSWLQPRILQGLAAPVQESSLVIEAFRLEGFRYIQGDGFQQCRPGIVIVQKEGFRECRVFFLQRVGGRQWSAFAYPSGVAPGITWP